MSKQRRLLNPLELAVLRLAIAPTLLSLFMLRTYLDWIEAMQRSSSKGKSSAPPTTPEEEELLLHLVD